MLTVNGTNVAYSGLPYSVWVYSGDRLDYTYNATVASTTTGKKFVLGTVSPASPLVNIQSAQTVTGPYTTQWNCTFIQSGLDNSITSGYMLTVNGTNIAYSSLPYSVWVNSGDRLVYTYNSTVSSSTAGKQFTGLTVSPTSPIVNIQSAQTVTGKYGTLILRPSAAGTYTQLSVNTGSNYNAVHDESSDSDSTYVYTTSTSSRYDTYNIPDTTLSGLTIQSITVHIVARGTSISYDGYARPTILIGGTRYYPSNYIDLTTSYAEYTNSWTTNPNGGSAWTWTDINNLEIGVQMYASVSGYQTRCTQVWVEITYNA